MEQWPCQLSVEKERPFLVLRNGGKKVAIYILITIMVGLTKKQQQQLLDFKAVTGLREFTRERALHAVMKLIATNNQVSHSLMFYSEK